MNGLGPLLYSRVPNKRGGGENNRGGGVEWFDITIIGGEGVLGKIGNSRFLW